MGSLGGNGGGGGVTQSVPLNTEGLKACPVRSPYHYLAISTTYRLIFWPESPVSPPLINNLAAFFGRHFRVVA